MNINSIVAEALRATESHKLHLRRACQHIAIRHASEDADGLFTTDQLRKTYEAIGRGSRPMMVWKLTRNIRIILRWLDEHPVQPSEVASQSTLFEI